MSPPNSLSIPIGAHPLPTRNQSNDSARDTSRQYMTLPNVVGGIVVAVVVCFALIDRFASRSEIGDIKADVAELRKQAADTTTLRADVANLDKSIVENRTVQKEIRDAITSLTSEVQKQNATFSGILGRLEERTENNARRVEAIEGRRP